jgi:hypothetical protein
MGIPGNAGGQLRRTGRLNPFTGDTEMVYTALLPEATEVPDGVAVSVKSEKKMVNEIDDDWVLLLPVTVRFKGLAETAESPVTVTTLDPPGEIALGLKLQVTWVLQVRAMVVRRPVLGPSAVTWNWVDELPMGTMLDRALAESVKMELPVPVKGKVTGLLTAFEIMPMLALSVPEPVGVKDTEIVQL